MTLPEKKNRLLAELNRFRNSQERFAHIVERAREVSSLSPQERADSFRVPGCLSKLWLVSTWREGRCYFAADAESAIVKSIAVLLCEFYSGQTPEEILKIDPSFLGEVGITQHLTPNRRNALSRVWETIRTFAQSYAGGTERRTP